MSNNDEEEDMFDNQHRKHLRKIALEDKNILIKTIDDHPVKKPRIEEDHVRDRSVFELSESGAINLLGDTLQFHLDGLLSSSSSLFVKQRALSQIIETVAALSSYSLQVSGLRSKLSVVLNMLQSETDASVIFGLLNLTFVLCLEESGTFNVPSCITSSIFETILNLTLSGSLLGSTNSPTSTSIVNRASCFEEDILNVSRFHSKRIFKKRISSSLKEPSTTIEFLEVKDKLDSNCISNSNSSPGPGPGPSNISSMISFESGNESTPPREKVSEDSFRTTAFISPALCSSLFGKSVIGAGNIREVALLLANRIITTLVLKSTFATTVSAIKSSSEAIGESGESQVTRFQDVCMQRRYLGRILSRFEAILGKVLVMAKSMKPAADQAESSSHTRLNIAVDNSSSSELWSELWMYIGIVDSLCFRNSENQNIFSSLDLQNGGTLPSLLIGLIPHLVPILFSNIINNQQVSEYVSGKVASPIVSSILKGRVLNLDIDTGTIGCYEVFCAALKCLINLSHRCSASSAKLVREEGIGSILLCLDMLYNWRCSLKDDNENGDSYLDSEDGLTTERMIFDIIIYILTFLTNLVECADEKSKAPNNLSDFMFEDLATERIRNLFSSKSSGYVAQNNANDFLELLIIMFLNESSVLIPVIEATEISSAETLNESTSHHLNQSESIPISEIILSAHICLLVHAMLYRKNEINDTTLYDPNRKLRFISVLPRKSFWLPIRILKAFLCLQQTTDVLIADSLAPILAVISIMSAE